MTCPGNPAPPPGYGLWKGPVPPVLTQWAMGIRDHINSGGFPFNTTWSVPYNDQLIVARKERHGWTYKNGQLVTGLCISGVTLYAPLTIDSAPPAGTIGTGDTPTANPNAGPALPPDQVTPSTDYGVFSSPPTDWSLIALSAGAGALVIGLFWLALHHAGTALPPKR